MVLRNYTGAFIKEKTMKVCRIDTILEAKAVGIEEALSWNMSRVIKVFLLSQCLLSQTLY